MVAICALPSQGSAQIVRRVDPLLLRSHAIVVLRIGRASICAADRFVPLTE